ncbi:fibronectin-III type domain-containing protein windei [Musca autumnalis]|uniref:fibronectin-III type domain-containing protein windei n=1 Tax=Musca autumnalis TaxID=221902 RepID=UPI003CF731E5
MMEVKQNTPVDLNDLLTGPVKTANVTTDEVDDVVMEDLSERDTNSDLNCDIIKPEDDCEKSNNGLVTNGEGTLSSTIDLDSTATSALPITPVNPELEDALLAEDDALPKLTDVKVNSIASSEPVAVDDILADKVETSNSTTSSTNVRDPGDDLDTLLSKINDIVEDCLDEEGAVTEDKIENEVVSTNVLDNNESKVESLEESVILLDDTAADESVLEIDKSIPIETESVQKSEDALENTKHEDDTSELNEKTETVEDIKELSDKEDGKENDTASENVADNEVVTEESSKEESEEVEKTTIETNATIGNEPDVSATKIVTEDKAPEEVPTDLDKISEDENLTELDKLSEPENTTDLDKMLVDDDETVDSIKENELLEEKNDDDTTLNECDKIDDLILSDNEKEDEASKEKDVAVEETKAAEEEPKVTAETGETQVEISLENKTENDESKDSKVEKETIETDVDLTESKDAKESPKKSEDTPENEDSDDEIVFYVDKPPEKAEETKSAEIENTEKSPKSPAVTASSEEKQPVECSKDKSGDEDDVVVLDDDDEMQGNKKPSPKKLVEEKPMDKESDNEQPISKTTEDSDAAIKEADRKHSTIDIDNSDNARDDFVVGTDKVAKKPEDADDNNSNCSSSSNLLLEAKQSDNTGDEPTPEENDNDEEEDDGDVELVEAESKDAENSSEKGEESSEAVPPAKRPRLSEDSELSSKADENSKSRRTSESLEKKTDMENGASSNLSTSLKRTHDVIELEMDDEKSNDSKSSVTESSTKKPRTEEVDDTKKLTDKENENEKLAKPDSSDDNQKQDVKKCVQKVEPSDVPIPLYPAPKLKNLGEDDVISLGFLKKFRKSFDKMTKQDLEELVLQKVVEAIIHRSEFAEMRELIEKQEKLITTHRTKISELSKQFRDLEMVHNRVVKDIEQRNAQFIMPVKITRAVGLQVYIPNKKSIMEANAATGGVSNSSNIPTVSPQRATAPTTSHNNLTSPQRQFHSPQTAPDASLRNTTTNTNVNSSSSNSAPRRGCAQKVTPIRPVPGSNTTSSSVSGSPTTNTASTQIYRNNLTQNQISQPRILNKNAGTSNTAMSQTSNMNAAALQRQRYLQQQSAKPPNQDAAQRMAQQQQNARPPTVSQQRVVQQQKMPNNSPTVPRRIEPSPSTGSNNTTPLDNYMNTLTQLTGGNTAVSITPAKPKEKAVIDLTDEDELPPASHQISPQQTNSAQAQRRSIPAQNSNTNTNNMSQQYGRPAQPLTRIPPSQVANSNKNRMQGQKNNSFTSTISTPPGTSITRINVAPNTQVTQRVKYSHPAPLPATPPQAFNPNWKLPPPRPTIRISNLDNGIVISWTMEESMDRHAECVSYQIYAYQETSGPPMADSWRHVGDVKAMLLPMAVTLTQFQEGQRYFFAVRAVDCHQRYGPFSLPKTWS